MTDAPPSRPPRKGLGCLSGLLALAVGVCVAIMAFDAVFDPWIYTVGGRLRLLPVWQGSGVTVGPGGDYRLYVLFYPTTAKQTVQAVTAVEGHGVLCTPSGQRIGLLVSGGAKGNVWRRMDGHEFHLTAAGPAKASIDPQIRRPRLYLTGAWAGPDLALYDNASLNHFFRPDGSLDPKAGFGHPTENGTYFLLHEGAWWPGGGGCGR